MATSFPQRFSAAREIPPHFRNGVQATKIMEPHANFQPPCRTGTAGRDDAVSEGDFYCG
jgi:hypothetical protein